MATDRNDVVGQQVALGEQRQPGGAGAEVQGNDAGSALLCSGRGKAAGVGRRHQPRDGQVGALGGMHEIAQRGGIGAHRVQIRAQQFAG